MTDSSRVTDDGSASWFAPLRPEPWWRRLRWRLTPRRWRMRGWTEIGATEEEDSVAGKTLGQIAYEAYGEAVGWVNHQGNPMPLWDDLPESITAGWQAAAEAVVAEVP